MIFLLTYLSGKYKVKGYLAFPHFFPVDKTDVQHWLEAHFKQRNLSVQPIACPISPWKVDEQAAPLSVVDKKNAHAVVRKTAQLPAALRLQSKLEKLPAFLYCRGGRGNFGRVKIEWLEQFARKGYIVFAPCYRGNEGGEGKDEFGGADKEDVLTSYQFLRSLPCVDNRKISVMGFSRGAINATQLAVEVDVHRLILWSGVADLAQIYRERKDLQRMLRKVVGGTPVKNRRAYEKRSPVFLAEKLACPVLIIHGTEDRFVPIQHALTMYQRLKELGLQVDLHVYEGEGHLFPYSVHLLAVQRMFQWIAEKD